jgi:hypothetical protein
MIPAQQNPTTLSPSQISSLSSEYLRQGVYQDNFEIYQATVQDDKLQALVKMTQFAISPTDQGGYHLTAPTIFRFLGQLLIIHGHVFFSLGLEKKVEVWVKEHTMKHLAPVRDPHTITVHGQMKGTKRARSNPAMIGTRYEFSINEGAVVGEALAFFDLASYPKILENLAL